MVKTIDGPTGVLAVKCFYQATDFYFLDTKTTR